MVPLTWMWLYVAENLARKSAVPYPGIPVCADSQTYTSSGKNPVV